MSIGDIEIAFVNCFVNQKAFLASENSKSQLPFIMEIDQTLCLANTKIEEVKGATEEQKTAAVSDAYDACIFMGGFNSPIEGSAEGVNALITSNMYEPLKKNDHMYLQFRNYVKNVMEGDPKLEKEVVYDNPHNFEENNLLSSYHEGEIMFGPTYKITPFSDNYDTSVTHKDEICSSGWTDRIMWTLKQSDEFVKTRESVKQVSYDSNNLVKSGNHRPVFSQFTVHL